jgi:L-amino acid N-acyltransferase
VRAGGVDDYALRPMPTPAVPIDNANEGDLEGILAIFNDVIATSTSVFSENPVALENRRAWFEDRRARDFPVLVVRDESGVVGFGSFGDFRAWPGYRFTVEHTVHVRADRRGHGIGTALIEALIERARSRGVHTMIAGVDAQNEGSLRLHERLGFVECARIPEVGFKWGQWLDLVFLARILS